MVLAIAVLAIVAVAMFVALGGFAAYIQTASPPGGGNGKWQKGCTTYFTAKEGGAIGKSGKRLTPFRSVAVKLSQYDKFAGREVEIRGFGVFVVEDGCAGGACKDFDIYVGGDAKNAERLPDWQKGNIPIDYRWV